jgi:hypothetical protein
MPRQDAERPRLLRSLDDPKSLYLRPVMSFEWVGIEWAGNGSPGGGLIEQQTQWGVASLHSPSRPAKG